MDGMRSLRPVFLDRANGINAPSDTLEESFINTMAAWVNTILHLDPSTLHLSSVATFAAFATKQVFIQRNLTASEIAHCEASVSPA
ncbi:unnamed protein product, partial [Aphanomyces euteiches]